MINYFKSLSKSKQKFDFKQASNFYCDDIIEL